MGTGKAAARSPVDAANHADAPRLDDPVVKATTAWQMGWRTGPQSCMRKRPTTIDDEPEGDPRSCRLASIASAFSCFCNGCPRNADAPLARCRSGGGRGRPVRSCAKLPRACAAACTARMKPCLTTARVQHVDPARRGPLGGGLSAQSWPGHRSSGPQADGAMTRCIPNFRA